MNGVVGTLLLVLHVEGGGGCPSAAEVETKLAPLLPGDFVASSADRASIREDADGTVLDLAGAPRWTQHRQPTSPARGARCTAQAETVAVTLAVWEAQIHPKIPLTARLARVGASRRSPLQRGRDASPARRASTISQTRERARQCRLALAIVVARLGRLLATRLCPPSEGGSTPCWVPSARRWRCAALARRRSEAHASPLDARSVPEWWRFYRRARRGSRASLSARAGQLALGAAGVLGVAKAPKARVSRPIAQPAAPTSGSKAMFRVGVRLGCPSGPGSAWRSSPGCDNRPWRSPGCRRGSARASSRRAVSSGWGRISVGRCMKPFAPPRRHQGDGVTISSRPSQKLGGQPGSAEHAGVRCCLSSARYRPSPVGPRASAVLESTSKTSRRRYSWS